MPSSTQSVAEMRTDMGLCSGHTARIAENTSSGKRSRLAKCAAISVGAPVAERRDERGQQVAVRAVQLDHVEAAALAPSPVARTKAASTSSMSARVIGRGT